MEYALFAMKSDDVWHKHRKLIQPGFSPLHLQYAASVALKCSDDIIGVIADLNKESSKEKGDSRSLEILPLISRVSLDVISLVAFGEDCGAILKPDRGNIFQFGLEQMVFLCILINIIDFKAIDYEIGDSTIFVAGVRAWG
jgi:cytochrome P450